MPLTGAYNVAQFVAYAASVYRNGTSPEAIRNIGKELGRATHEDSIQMVHCPLLGAGAGRLPADTVVDELSRGFGEESKAGSVLKIFVLDASVYARLVQRSVRSGASSVGEDSVKLSHGGRRLTVGEVPPRVLISYSHHDPANKQWVHDLYDYLCANGVYARLDTERLKWGMDIQQWMTNEIRLADRVILVCDEDYAARADGRHGGVGWETMIIQGQIYADMNRDQPEDAPAKFIPVVRSVDLDAGLPVYLQTKLALHIPPGSPEGPLLHQLLVEILPSGSKSRP
jgi:hypothetical protein